MVLSKRKREDTPEKSPVKASSSKRKQEETVGGSPVKSPSAKRMKSDSKTPDFTKVRNTDGTGSLKLVSLESIQSL